MTKEEILENYYTPEFDHVKEGILKAMKDYADQEVSKASFELGKRTGELTQNLIAERDAYKAGIENYIECLHHYLEMKAKKASRQVIFNAENILKDAGDELSAISSKYKK